MGDIKLIALDMDGTLLDDEGNVSQANREAIDSARQRGIDVVLSTGRFIGSVREYARSLNLSHCLITVNGSEIWLDGKLYERHVLPADLLEWMLSLAREYGTFYWGTSTTGAYHRDNFPDDVREKEWLKFGFDTDDDDVRRLIWDKLIETGRLEVSNSSPTNVEVNVKGISKARALKTVCQLKNTAMSNVLAIGDSLNDIKMIRQAGWGVAMGNAQQRVKEAADWVTATNNENGVAQAIRRFALER